MAEIKWIKLSVNMFDDEKIKLIRSMPEGTNILLVWIYLLTLAGKTNASGYIFLAENIPYTDEMLASIMDMPLNIVRIALKIFSQFGMIEVDENNYILISNWEKHQNIDGMDRIREQTRLRVAKHRAKKKELEEAIKGELAAINEECNVTVTYRNAIEEEKEEEEEEEKEEDKDIEKEKEKRENSSSRLKKIANEYEKAGFGTINHTIKELLEDLLEQYSDEWIIQAFKECARRNKRSLSYASGILENWRREGGMKLGGEQFGSTTSNGGTNKKYDVSRFINQG